MNGEASKFEQSEIPPVLRLPSEMIINILSYCDHHSLVNAMKINQTWRNCGEYLMNKSYYWHERCSQNIPVRHLDNSIWKGTRGADQFKHIFLKWMGWRNLKDCPNCTNQLKISRPKPCGVHKTTVDRKTSRKYLDKFYNYVRAIPFSIEHDTAIQECVVKLRTIRNQQVFCVVSSCKIYAENVETVLPAMISCFLHYGGIFFAGLQNGLVLIYNVESWVMFDLAVYDMKITGIHKEIEAFYVQECNSRRILYIGTSKCVYKISWIFDE